MKKILILGIVMVALCSVVVQAQDEEHAPALDGKYWMSQLVKFVNLAVVVGVLVFLLNKPIRAFFSKRADQIETDLKAAEIARKEAEEKLKEVEKEISLLETRMSEIHAKAAKEGEVEKQRIIVQAKEDAERILKASDIEITNRLKSARKELKAYAAKLAVDKAREMIVQQIDDSSNEKIIGKTISSIGGDQ